MSHQNHCRLRKRIVRLRKSGKKNIEIAEELGISQSYASKVWKKYHIGGEEALKPKRRGRLHGSGRILNSDQELAAVELIINNTPDQLCLPFHLWSQEAVRQLVRRQFSMDLPIRTVSDYMRRWKFNPVVSMLPPKNCRDFWEESWFQEHLPLINSRAKEEKAEISWFNRSNFNNDILDRNTQGYENNARIQIMSSITNKGHHRFKFHRGFLTSQVMIKFFSLLIKDVDKKVFLIMSSHRYHQTKKIKQWLNSHRPKIEIFYLPVFPPESFWHSSEFYQNWINIQSQYTA